MVKSSTNSSELMVITIACGISPRFVSVGMVIYHAKHMIGCGNMLYYCCYGIGIIGMKMRCIYQL